MAEKVVVTVLRLKPEDLTVEEVALVRAAFGNDDVTFVGTNPSDYLVHDEECTEHNARAVYLPRERPIPSKALERGIPHIVVINGQLMELEKIEVKFKPFVPKPK